MIEIKSPAKLKWDNWGSIFLGGSIEMGIAEDWQAKLTAALTDYNVALFNPRRNDWDSTWVQSIDNPQFNEQVNWELSAIEEADFVVFYFDPATKSPITLMELGLCAGAGRGLSIIVCCPDGYWRKGNVEIVCKRYGMDFVNTFDELVNQLKRSLHYAKL